MIEALVLCLTAITKLRNGDNLIGQALRMGTCYPDETTFVALLVHKRLP